MPNVNYARLDTEWADWTKPVPPNRIVLGKERNSCELSLAPLFFLQPVEWQERSACAGLPTDLFFPELTEKGKRPHQYPEVVEAVGVCRSCPVRRDCEDYAEETRVEYGIWGGFYFNRGKRTTVAC